MLFLIVFVLFLLRFYVSVDYCQFVQKGDSFQNLHVPEDYFPKRNFLIFGFIFVHDHTEIAVRAILGYDASHERIFEIIYVVDDVTTLILELFQESNFTHHIVISNHFKHSPFIERDSE
jgi:hypothetical protein